MAAKVASGTRGEAIAAEVGCSAPMVYKTVRDLGLTWPHRTPAKLRDREWLREQYIDKLWGTTAIAAEVGCSDSTVKAALKRCGIPTRTQMEGRGVRSARLRSAVTMPDAAEQYRTGKTLVYLGERYGVSEHVVREVLVDAGITIRTKAAAWEFIKKDPVHVARRKQAQAHRRRPTGVRDVKRLIEQDAICCWCQSPEDIEQHHINAVRSDTRSENLAPLCRACHAKLEWFINHATDGLRRAYGGVPLD